MLTTKMVCRARLLSQNCTEVWDGSVVFTVKFFRPKYLLIFFFKYKDGMSYFSDILSQNCRKDLGWVSVTVICFRPIYIFDILAKNLKMV